MNKKTHLSEWDSIKEKVQAQWEKLTDTDLNHIKTIEQQMCDLLEKKYQFSKESAKKEIDDFFDEVKKDQHHVGTVHKEMDELKKTVVGLSHDFIHQITELPHMSEEAAKTTVKTHPLASVGWAAGIGFVLGLFLTHKK